MSRLSTAEPDVNQLRGLSVLAAVGLLRGDQRRDNAPREVMPGPSSPSRGVAQTTTPNQRARMSQPPAVTSTSKSSSRHNSQNASGAAMPASAATTGRAAASLRAAIALSADVSLSTPVRPHSTGTSTTTRRREVNAINELEAKEPAGVGEDAWVLHCDEGRNEANDFISLRGSGETCGLRLRGSGETCGFRGQVVESLVEVAICYAHMGGRRPWPSVPMP
jgi:hypothetical protein